MARLISVLEPRPIIDLNTTPLIDVMLVLLIMFIITIPIQTHAVKFDVPTCNNCPEPNATKNEVAITQAGAILWNGKRLRKTRPVARIRGRRTVADIVVENRE